MRKFALAATIATGMLMAGSMSWRAETMPLPQTAALPQTLKQLLPVEKAACGGPGRYCRTGFHWVCGPRHCWCARC